MQLFETYEPYIKATARSIERTHPKVEAEDIEQEMRLFLYEKGHHFEEHECSEAYIKKSVKNVGINYALKVRDTVLRETNQFYYNFEDVKELLPTFFGPTGDWDDAPIPEGCRSEFAGDGLAMVTDIKIAYDSLTPAQQDILRRRYKDDEELTEGAERTQASRALKRLVMALNVREEITRWKYSGPGSRKAITNAQGIYEARVEVG